VSTAPPVRSLYLEDLAAGDEFRSSSHRIDAAQIIAFASEFDPQPFHTDPEAAKHSFFGGLAASGWHAAALAMKLIVQSFPLAGGVIGAGVEVKWLSPVRPGETLHVISTILEIVPSRSKPNQSMLIVESRMLNQDGVLKQTITSKMLAFSQGAAPAAPGNPVLIPPPLR
jgi:acyl dehydratase